MDIIVCIKQVPGTNSVEVDEKTGVLKRENVASKINPYDLYALETALLLKEAFGAKVTALTMGPPQSKSILEEAIWMGVDDAVILTDRQFAGADVLATAYTLAQGMKKTGEPTLIICGKQTTDGDTAQVGAELAETLNIPHVNNVVKVREFTEVKMIVDADMETQIERQEIYFPCLFSVDKGINIPRLPSYKRKKEYKSFVIKSFTIADFEDKSPDKYGLKGSPTQVERIFAPEKSADSVMWEGNSLELTQKLFKELKREKFI